MKNRIYVTGFLATHFEKGFGFITKNSPTKNGGVANNDIANFVVSIDSGSKGNDGKTLYQTAYCTAYGAQARMLYEICTMPFEQRKALPSLKIDICGTIVFGYAGFDNEKNRSVLIPNIKISCEDVDILDNNYKLLPDGVYNNNGQQVGQQMPQNNINGMYQQQNNMYQLQGQPNFGIGANANFNNPQGQNNMNFNPNGQQPNQQANPQQNNNFDFSAQIGGNVPFFNFDPANYNATGTSNTNNNLMNGVKSI